MEHLPRDTVQLCMESCWKLELRSSGFQKPFFVQAGMLGSVLESQTVSLQVGMWAPDESSLVRGTEAGEIPLLLHTSIL